MNRRANLENLKALAGQLREFLPQLRSYVNNPRAVGALLEEYNPSLGRRFLSAASNLAEPYLVGMGMTVERLSEERVEVSMPARWRNRAGGGIVHVGALTTLAEFTSRIYWERHLDWQLAGMRLAQMQAKFLKEADSDVRAVLTIAENEREAALFRLRSEDKATVETVVSVYDGKEQLVAQMSIEWELERRKALGPGSSQGT